MWAGGEKPSIKDPREIIWPHAYGSYLNQALREACYQTEKESQKVAHSKVFKSENKGDEKRKKIPQTFRYNFGMLLLGDAPLEECPIKAGQKINPHLCKMYDFSTPDSVIKETTNCLEDYQKDPEDYF